MKTRIIAGIGVALLIIGGVIFAAAQNGPAEGQRPGQPRGERPPPPPPFGVPDVEHLTRDLGLTDAQAAELKPFLDNQRGVIDALMQKLDEAHRQIETASAEGKFDEAQIRALAGQQAQTMTDLIVEQQRTKSKIYNVLTVEQRAKLQQFHKRGGPHERGPGGPEGPHGRGPGGPGGPPPPPPPGV